MSNIAVKPTSTPQAHDLRRTFETALAQVQNGDAPRKRYMPIAVRKNVTLPDAQATEKRALTDAARALAQLWNISPALVR
jgi:hypothetical protein